MNSIYQATLQSIRSSIKKGFEGFKVVPPMTGVEWADKYFYLSPESSYQEGPWTTQPVQIVPLNLMCNDDVEEVDLRKSARIGYTKMLLAATLFLAAHKKRNVGIWREDDGRAEGFVNLELDNAIRDCKPVAAIFPDLGKKTEHNNKEYKQLIGSAIHVRGGHAAGGYRELSKDVVIADEIDAFVQNVQGKSSKEGNPILLMFKRLVGSFFPKKILGTTPTVEGSSHIEKREKIANCRIECYVPCPHCGELQTFKFGDGKVPYGFTWEKGDPDSVAYRCEHCEGVFHYEDYLDIAPNCVWMDKNADIKTTDGIYFYSIKTGLEVKTPRHVCVIIWAAYSPTSHWKTIVYEFLEAKADKESLQVFTNTTLGQYWRNSKTEKLDSTTLWRRRSHYQKDDDGSLMLPEGALYLTAGVDTQDNRFAYEIVAWGAGKKNWSVEYRELMGEPDDPVIQAKLVELLSRTFKRADGIRLPVGTIFHDAGGSYYDDILKMSARIDPNWWVACKGDYQVGSSYIKLSGSQKAKEIGCHLFMVGTTSVGDLVARQINRLEPEPICHWPFTDDVETHFSGHDLRYFEMFTAEEKVWKYVKNKLVGLWECPKGARNEAWDCRRYATAAVIFAETYSGLDLQAGVLPVAERADPKPPPRRESNYMNRG